MGAPGDGTGLAGLTASKAHRDARDLIHPLMRSRWSLLQAI